jgi:hypothetical protein
MFGPALVRTVTGAFLATGDILFLLLFIVLPTAVIVSGIWAIVFVRWRPPAVRVASLEDVDATAESSSVAEPAPEIALAVAATMVDEASESDAAARHEDAVAPVLSEREAIASIDPLAADLLFDQPLPPPPAPEPFADSAPTEEMPSVERAALDLDSSVTDDSPADGTTPTSDAMADEEIATDDEPAVSGPATAELVAETATPPVEELRHDIADELNSEADAEAVTDKDIALDQTVGPGLDDHSADADPMPEAATDDDTLLDADARPADGDVAGDADPEADEQADSPTRRRGPLRLIPSDEQDPRDRRRARNSGRRAPQLPRSVRRNERGV